MSGIILNLKPLLTGSIPCRLWWHYLCTILVCSEETMSCQFCNKWLGKHRSYHVITITAFHTLKSVRDQNLCHKLERKSNKQNGINDSILHLDL